jgi:hypothetical protein
MQSTKERNAFLLELGKGVVATVIATASACWTARGLFANQDRRMTVIEVQHVAGEAQRLASEQNVTNAITNVRGEIADVRVEIRELRAAVMNQMNTRQHGHE